MSDLRHQRDIARRLEQTQVKEVPGGILGFTTFYETGLFTPAYEGLVTAGSWTYSVQTGFYTRTGNRCEFNLSLTAATRPGGPAGAALIVGLPFVSIATVNSHSPVVLDTLNAITLSATCTQLTARIPPGVTYIELIENLGTAPITAGALAATGLTATAFVRVAGSYMV